MARRPVCREGESDLGRAAPLDAAAVLSTAAGGWRREERPDAARARAEAAAPVAEISVRSASGCAARGAARRHDAWAARPRDAGDALCDRLARLGARRIEVDAGRLERRH